MNTIITYTSSVNKSRSIFTVISIVFMIFNNYLSVEETENQCHNGALQKKKKQFIKITLLDLSHINDMKE